MREDGSMQVEQVNLRPPFLPCIRQQESRYSKLHQDENDLRVPITVLSALFPFSYSS